MANKNIYTLGFLIILTAITALVSTYDGAVFYASMAIMVLSGLKFIMVAFSFMELGKAHIFWKLILLLFLALYIGIILIAK